MVEARIRRFQPGDEETFRRLNEAWIERHFRLEEKDRQVLGDPHGQILDPGGAILIAESDGVVIGCCALIPAAAETFELAKMAVTPECQGRGVGRDLVAAAIATARSMSGKRLFLETNSKLAPALRLYERAGFVHAARVHQSEYDRANVYMEMAL